MRFLILLFLTFFSFLPVYANTEKDSVLLALFETLKHKEDYVRDKEQRIEDIKKLLIMPDISDNQRYIEEEIFDVDDLVASVVDLACEYTGYGITEWEFKKRSFDNNIFSELYKFML